MEPIPTNIPLSLLLQCDGIHIVDKRDNEAHWPLFLWEPVYKKIEDDLNHFDIIWYKDLAEVWAFEPKDIPKYIIKESDAELCYKSCKEDYDRYKAFFEHTNLKS